MSTGRNLIKTTPTVCVGHGQIGANGVCSFFESVAVIELDPPTLFSFLALHVMSAFSLAVAPGIHLFDAAPITKCWLKKLGKRVGFEDFFGFRHKIDRCTIRVFQTVRSCAIKSTFAAESESRAAQTVTAFAVACASSSTCPVIFRIVDIDINTSCSEAIRVAGTTVSPVTAAFRFSGTQTFSFDPISTHTSIKRICRGRRGAFHRTWHRHGITICACGSTPTPLRAAIPSIRANAITAITTATRPGCRNRGILFVRIVRVLNALLAYIVYATHPPGATVAVRAITRHPKCWQICREVRRGRSSW